MTGRRRAFHDVAEEEQQRRCGWPEVAGWCWRCPSSCCWLLIGTMHSPASSSSRDTTTTAAERDDDALQLLSSATQNHRSAPLLHVGFCLLPPRTARSPPPTPLAPFSPVGIRLLLQAAVERRPLLPLLRAQPLLRVMQPLQSRTARAARRSARTGARLVVGPFPLFFFLSPLLLQQRRSPTHHILFPPVLLFSGFSPCRG